MLAYGQTGAGKTHTLFGAVTDPEQQGVVPRAIAHLGQGISGALSQGQAIFKVRAAGFGSQPPNINSFQGLQWLAGFTGFKASRLRGLQWLAGDGTMASITGVVGLSRHPHSLQPASCNSSSSKMDSDKLWKALQPRKTVWR